MNLPKEDQDLVIVARTGKYLLTQDKTHYRLEVYNSRLANEVNSLLKTYGSYLFQTSEEAVFKVIHPGELNAVKTILARWNN